MRIKKIEITNFRSIKDKLTIEGENLNLLTLIGGNSSGKSNILRAVNLFFNGDVENGIKYSPTTDLHVDNPTKQARIFLLLSFSKSDDKSMTSVIDKSFPSEFSNYEIPITLLLYPNGGHQYSFTVAGGKKKNLPELLSRILDYVNCIYIPAIKDYKTILNKQMLKKIVALSFHGYAKGRSEGKKLGLQKEKFQKLLGEVQEVLNESGDIASDIISNAVDGIDKFSFSLPYDNLEEFLGTVFFEIKEKNLSKNINLENVGSGVQSFTIFTMLKLLHELRPKNTYKKSKFLWLIEEPETFMHHDLQRMTKDKLAEYSKEGIIFLSSHSPVFVNKSNFLNSYVVTNTTSTQIKHINIGNILQVLTGNLGVDIHDFLPIKRYNMLVEGETDKKILTEIYKLFKAKDSSMKADLKDLEYLVCGSASSIPHFYHVYNVFNQYSDFMCLFDRDAASTKPRADLLNKGVNEDNLLFVPKSTFKTNNEIEDIVDKPVWDSIIKFLDSKSLISVVSKQGQIVDYSFEERNRIQVKKIFSEKLIEEAKKDLSKFGLFKSLFETFQQTINKLNVS